MNLLRRPSFLANSTTLRPVEDKWKASPVALTKTGLALYGVVSSFTSNGLQFSIKVLISAYNSEERLGYDVPLSTIVLCLWILIENCSSFQ